MKHLLILFLLIFSSCSSGIPKNTQVCRVSTPYDQFKVGDCFGDGNSLYKVVKKGAYGLTATLYGSDNKLTDNKVYFYTDSLNTVHQIDCVENW